MAALDTRHLGTQYLFYWSASASPVDPDEITNYELVGQSTGIALAATSETVTIRDKDGTTNIPSTGSYTVTGGFNAVAEGDDGQTALYTAKGSKARGAWLITDLATGHIQFRGTGTVTDYGQDKPDNNAATGSFTIAGGEELWTEEAVPA